MIVVVSPSECLCSKTDERRDWIEAGAQEFFTTLFINLSFVLVYLTYLRDK